MSVTTSQLLHVPLDQLAPDPLQPRTDMPMDALRELAESLKRHGVIEPLVATEQVDAGESAPRYLILAGERRWRAAQLAGLATVPVVLREPPRDATERLVLQIAENDVREDLSLLDRARAVERALQESGLSKKEFAERLGRSLPWLSNLLAVMAAAGSTLEALEHGLIRHGETVRSPGARHADHDGAGAQTSRSTGGAQVEARSRCGRNRECGRRCWSG
jgi:ParB family transcriptional regulator, chromosome partitioning protein